MFYDEGGASTPEIVKITVKSGFQDYTSIEFDLPKGLSILELKIPSVLASLTCDYMIISKVVRLSVNKFGKNN